MSLLWKNTRYNTSEYIDEKISTNDIFTLQMIMTLDTIFDSL